MNPADRLEHALDGRARRLRDILRWAAGAGVAVGAVELAAGLAFAEWRVSLFGLLVGGFAVWLFRAVGAIVGPDRDRAITEIAFLTLATIAGAAVLEPGLAPALAVAALLPAVFVLPFLTSAAVGRVLVVAGLVGIGSMAARRIVPPNDLPSGLTDITGGVALLLAYGFLIAFLWEVGRRLKANAEDLRSIVAMSNDLSRSMDPQLVGDRIARHIAGAVGASDCALSYWDRADDRLVTLGYHPLERRGALQPTYRVADYPQTREVLEGGTWAIVDTADPAADAQEVAYLRSIGQRSMAILPLVAAGTTIGTVELTSERDGAFDERDVEIAMMLAGEAAMALENARLYDELRHQALHDNLTGLANRVLFRERVAQALERSRGRSGRPFAVLFIDLDDFKVLNDTLGHARGDEVLVATARRVAGSLRPGDTAARLGGDEFAVLLDDVADELTALTVAVRLADALREPLDLGDAAPAVAASIGVAISGEGGTTADDLLRNADVAMYAAKASSRGRAELFRSSLRAKAGARSELAAQLRGADQRDELRLDYQPIVNLASGNVVGVEALVRWQPPDRPLLMPNEFIDLAEETGEIFPMGRWILRQACRQAREWQVRLALPELQVSVNLSARQFQEHDLVESVEAILAETGLDPSNLVLEITESGLMSRTAGTIGRLTALRARGIHLAIDDFGTGYSSLSYLERFPIDILKIDRSFIAGMSPDGDRPAIARAIVELGRTLELQVVAEGVETPDQAEWLRSLGCPLGQGYLYARPMGVDATEAFLAGDATRQIREAEEPPATAAADGRRARRTRRLRLVAGE